MFVFRITMQHTKALGISSLRRPVNKSFHKALLNEDWTARAFPIPLAASTPSVFPSSLKQSRFFADLIASMMNLARDHHKVTKTIFQN